MPHTPAIEPGDICLDCGICCGVPMFSHVELTNEDRKTLLNMGHTQLSHASQFTFPCPNQCGSACGIYDARPKTCRDYRCKSLARAQSGEISVEDAREAVSGVAKLYRDFLEKVPATLAYQEAKIAIENNECPAGLNADEFQRMRLAFVALQVAIDRHIRPKDEALVQSAMQ